LRPELAEISKTFHEKISTASGSERGFINARLMVHARFLRAQPLHIPFCPILSGGRLQKLRADLQGGLINSALAFR